MSTVAAAIVPLTLLIALGFALRRAAFLPEPFWPGLDRLNYWVLFPALIFVSLATARGGLEGSGRVALAVWGGLAVVATLALLGRRVLAADGRSFTSAFQGSVRFNSFAAFAVVPVLFPGAAGLTALLVAMTVPVVNVASVTVLARFAGRHPLRWSRVARSVAGNPLIVASLAGIAVRSVQLPLGPFEDALGLLGQASLGTGLLSVGATLRFRGVAAQLRPIAGSSVLKLVALPLATWGFARALGVPPEQLAPVLVFQALPTSSAAFVLARAMGGDERLMASILAIQTALALGWLPIAFGVVGRVVGGP